MSVAPPDDLVTRVGKVTAPVLVIAGADDCVTGLAPVKALATRFPSGRVEVLDRCGPRSLTHEAMRRLRPEWTGAGAVAGCSRGR